MRSRSTSLSGGSVFRLKPLACGVAACFAISTAFALPAAPIVVSGGASFAQSGNVLTVKNTPSAIINWQSFSIGRAETTKFIQTSASSAVLNRITGQDPSTILGALQSNGRVFLINPNGIVFGQGSRIDVAGLVASTLNIRDEDFLAGKLAFTAGATAGTLTNQGAITTPGSGHVYLIAPDVENSGIITSPKGEVLLAAGKSVQLVDVGTPDLRVEISAPGNEARNIGNIAAAAGRIGIAGALARNSGTLNASSAVEEGGRVFLRASRDTYVDGSGRIVATGTKGGRVEVLGDRVAVMDNATIDVSGQNGGGMVLVGGDYQGKNPGVQNARITYFGLDAALRADATDRGDGGKVIVWADDTTRAYGAISARGGTKGGDGGFVETSGKRYLDVGGIRVDTRAPKGVAGSWLLDPTDIDIIDGTVAAYGGSWMPEYGGGAMFSPGSDIATITDGDINANLLNGSVIISSENFDYYGSGNITVHSGVDIVNSSGAPRSLQLFAPMSAALTVQYGASIHGGSTGSPLAVSLSGGTVSIAGAIDGKGAGTDGAVHLHATSGPLQVAPTGSIASSGSGYAITLQADSLDIQGAINANAGWILVQPSMQTDVSLGAGAYLGLAIPDPAPANFQGAGISYFSPMGQVVVQGDIGSAGAPISKPLLLQGNSVSLGYTGPVTIFSNTTLAFAADNFQADSNSHIYAGYVAFSPFSSGNLTVDSFCEGGMCLPSAFIPNIHAPFIRLATNLPASMITFYSDADFSGKDVVMVGNGVLQSYGSLKTANLHVTSNGDVTLNQPGNNFTGQVSVDTCSLNVGTQLCNFAAGFVTLSSTNGYTDGQLNLAGILTSSGSVNLTAGDGGISQTNGIAIHDFIAETLTLNSTGPISLTHSGNIFPLLGNVTAVRAGVGQTISLRSSTNISQEPASAIYGGAVTMTTYGGLTLDQSLNNFSSLAATNSGYGSIVVSNYSNGLTLGVIDNQVAGLGNATTAIAISDYYGGQPLTLTGNITATSGKIQLAGYQGIDVNNTSVQHSVNSAGDITLDALSGNIWHSGSAGINIASNSGVISVNAPYGSVDIGGSMLTNDINISWSGNYMLGKLDAANSVTLNVYGGSISDAMYGGNAYNIKAPTLNIKTYGGGVYDIGSLAYPIRTEVTNLNAIATGSTWISNLGNLTLAGANSAGSIFALRSTGNIVLGGTLNTNTVFMKAGGSLDLGSGMTAVGFSGVSGSYLNAFNNGSLNLVYGGAWTGSSQSVAAGGVNATSGEAIAIRASGGNLAVNGGIAASAGGVFLGGTSISIAQNATTTITGASELNFSTDGLTFGSYGGAVSSLTSLHFGTATAGRPIGLYSGTAPGCTTSNSCLAIDLAKLKTTINGVSRIGFGNDSGLGAIAPPSGDITLYAGLTSANLPPGVTDVGLMTGGTVVQNGQAISVPKLGVSAVGDIVLTTSIDTFAAKTGGSLTLTNDKALTLGGVGDLADPAEFLVGINTLGAVTISAAGTLTNDGGISASNAPVALTTTVGNIVNNAPGIASYGGNVILRSAGGISTALVDAGSGDVSLIAYGGGIADLDGAAPNIIANRLMLDVTGASDFGTQVGALAGNTHGGNLRITQNGALGLAGLDLGTGNLDMTVYGGALTGPATGVALSGNAVKLAASSIDLNTNVAAIDATAADFITVTSGRSLSFAGTSGGDVTVRTVAPIGGNSDITLGLIKAAGKKVTLDAAGQIIDGNDGTLPALNIEAAALDFKSAAGIGVGNQLETKVSGITILNDDGNVEIANQGALTLGPITLNGTGNFILDNVGKVETKAPTNVYGGSATIKAHSPIVIGAALTASGDIILLTTDDGTPGDTITINGPLKSGGNITVSANDTIFQNANVTSSGAGTINFTSASGGIVMKAGTLVSSLGGIISFDAAGNIVLSQLTTGSTGSVSVKTSGGTISSSITGNNITTALMVLSAKSGISNIYFDAQYADVTTETGIVTIVNSVTGDVFSNDPALAETEPEKQALEQALEQQLTSSTLAATDSIIPGAGETTVALLGGDQGGEGNGDGENKDKKKKGKGESDEGKKDETLKPSRLPVCR
jgi:filamentous hemagglutinin family protein